MTDHQNSSADIVDRLRDHFKPTGITKSATHDLLREAANAIEDMRAELTQCVGLIPVAAQSEKVTALIAAVEEVCSWDWSGGDACKEALLDMNRLQDAYEAYASQPSPAATVETGCICQDQHRRGYCTEPGCPNSLTRCSAGSASAWRVWWVSLNTSRTELFEDHDKATTKARETGGCTIPLYTAEPQRDMTKWPDTLRFDDRDKYIDELEAQIERLRAVPQEVPEHPMSQGLLRTQEIMSGSK